MGTLDGILGVTVRGPPIKKIRPEKTRSIVTKEMIDDGSIQLDVAHMDASMGRSTSPGCHVQVFSAIVGAL